MKEVQVTAAVILPGLPNFLRLSDGGSIGVEAIHESGLRAIGEAWTAALIEHGLARRREAATEAAAS